MKLMEKVEEFPSGKYEYHQVEFDPACRDNIIKFYEAQGYDYAMVSESHGHFVKRWNKTGRKP